MYQLMYDASIIRPMQGISWATTLSFTVHCPCMRASYIIEIAGVYFWVYMYEIEAEDVLVLTPESVGYVYTT